MKVRVLLFAELRETVGRGELELELPEGSTVAGLLAALRGEHPALAGLLPRAKVAVDRELVGEEVELRPGSEVALIPPVGGG